MDAGRAEKASVGKAGMTKSDPVNAPDSPYCRVMGTRSSHLHHHHNNNNFCF
jgi:hypothetical protein